MRRLGISSLLVGLLAVAILGGTPVRAEADNSPEKEALVSQEARAAEQSTFLVPPTCSGNANNLLYPLSDPGWMFVPFFENGASGNGPAPGPAQTAAGERNDDDSATVAPLGFTFDLYGDLFTSAFVNQNGNISFAAPFSTFSSVSFPSTQFRMVAGFWGDVDTRVNNDLPGDTYQKLVDGNGDSQIDTLVVTWDNVGYYNEQHDKRNTFQIAISDGTNPRMGLGNNVCFSYDNMCWTTGSASGGVGGFGGTPATVGVNRGNGVQYFQIGRFSQNNAAYDGPYGSDDGINYLDGRLFCFSTATTNNNICPIPAGFPPGDQFTLSPPQVLGTTLQFLSPEAGQTTTVTVSDPNGAQAQGLTIVNTPGNPASSQLAWATDCNDLGDYLLTFHATDNFTPPCTTDRTLALHVTCDDGDGCTVDSCDPGMGCRHTPVLCDDFRECTDDSCNPATGQCVYVADDTNTCGNQGQDPCRPDRCVNGTCVTTVVDCNDGDACTADSCDPATGTCIHCASCVTCDDGDPCTDDSCDRLLGCQNVPNTAPCEDGNPCTTNDACGTGLPGCVPPPSGIVAWWAGDGDATDRVGGHHGTPINGATFAPGKVDQAFSFNGADWVEVPDDPVWTLGTRDFSIDLWVEFNQPRGRQPFIGHDDGGGEQNKWIFWYDVFGHDKLAGVPALRFHINSPHPSPVPFPHDAVAAPWNPLPGRWYHVAVTRSGNLYALYIDGAQVATDISTYSIPDPSVPLSIGMAEGATHDGLVDEVEIHDRALGAAEIQAIFDAGSAGKCKAGCVPGTPADCDDHNPCTDDSCDPASGCRHVNNTAPCDDGLLCNGHEVCGGGTCNPGVSLVCDDHNDCTDDTCDETTGCHSTPDDTNGCTDGNACTVDSCLGGYCQSALIDCNDHSVCTNDSCNPASGCVNAPVGCDDGNACTTDACDAASGCTHVTIDCRDTNKCTNDSCNPAIGCVNLPLDCNDGNGCTTDACDPGSGCSHTTVNCNDASACTNDSCDPASGCRNVPVICDDGNACTTDACNPASGCSFSAASCFDGNTCTTDTCNPATGCVNGSITCDDHNPCTDDSCNPGTGCVYTPNNGNACSDGNACTNDACVGGACIPTPVVCDDHNACTDDTCDSTFGCHFMNDDTNACTDGNACSSDTCVAGSCIGAAIVCNDHNPCTDDSCDPSTGCRFTNDDTNACTDGSACTNDACVGGSCVGTAIVCDDHDPCTQDSCNPATGCVYSASTDPDGDGICCPADNCCTVANPGQANADGDMFGDACDPCPLDPLNDADADGVCGNIDNCPTVPNTSQVDTDGDGSGDACDPCPLDPANDADHDGVCGDVDNCPTVPNPGQEDGDHDGVGDACETACPDSDGDGVNDCDDSCPHSCLDPTVIIPPSCLPPPPPGTAPGTAPSTTLPCDTGVPNYLLADGCTIEDKIAACDAASSNQGQFDKCVKALLNQLKKQHVITEAQRKAIDKCIKRYKKRAVHAGPSGGAGSIHGSTDR